jgi:murein DD-endopeptidase MepM/ murein hydrolase activator NlpD
MRWLPLSLIVCLLLAGPAGHAAAPAAPSSASPHGLAVAPVPGAVVRDFVPPPTQYAAGHRGVDLAASPGEPVVAAMGGRITFAGPVALVGWVTVDHGGGLSTTYGPLQPRAVIAGQSVARGTLLGFLAPHAVHLDWGARLDGEYIDPLALLRQWEAYLTNDTLEDDHALLAAAEGFREGAIAVEAGGFVRPAAGPVTSGFGPRVHPVTGEHRQHAGLDIGAPHGAPVVAARAGVVTFAGDASGYGRTVIIDHGGGLTTLYAHLSAVRVRSGQSVAAGGTIGAVGATGVVTGPHLHFEVRSGGVAQDPAAWL